MIRFRTLGTIDLETEDGTELRSVLAQPKRVALLTYLACATPRGFHRRDALVEIFWPERDGKRARGSLNTAVYQLRRSLGAHAVVSRGTEEVGIDPERVQCDVVAFDRAMHEGDLESALDHYGGEFLPGFFLSGARRWERWQESRRTGLRDRACTAAGMLAERAADADDVEAAVRWARRSLRIAPNDEPALRRLLALLDRAGDRAAALREYEAFVRRFREDVGIEVSAETRSLVEDVRAAPGRTRSERPDDAGITGPDGDADPPDPERPRAELHQPERADAGRRSRRVPGIVGGAIAACLLALLALWLSPRGGPSGSEAVSAPSAVAVLPFTAAEGDTADAALAESMVDLLSAALSGAGGLRTVDPRALLNVLDARDTAGSVRAGAADIVERFGARYVVTGSVAPDGDSIALQASLLAADSLTAATPLARASAAGPPDRLPSLVDELAREILAGLPNVGGDDLVRAAARTSGSSAALRAYLDGQRALRTGDHDAAAAAFGRAAREDSTFALAYYGWSNAALWLGRSDLADEARDAALRHGEALPDRYRTLLRAWERHWTAEPVEAERLYRDVTTRHPDDVEAWYQLGDLLFHWGPLVGRPLTSARWAFERTLDLEPHNVNALTHLARIAGTDGRVADLDSLVTRVLTHDPAPPTALELRLIRAVSRGDDLEVDALLRRARFAADRVWLPQLVRSVAVHTPDPAAAARVARDFITPQRQEDWHWFRLYAAGIEAARGRWQAAGRELDSLAVLHPERGTEYRAFLATLPFLDLPDAEVRIIRERFPEPGERVVAGPGVSHLTSRTIYPPRALLLLGLLSVRLDDLRSARAYADTLDRFSGGDDRDLAFAAEFARTLRARIDHARGELRPALERLGPASVPQDSLLPTLVSYPNAYARWLRAEILLDLGRDRDALEWFATFPGPTAYDIMFAGAAHLRRAEIHERLGEPDGAARHYARALEIWADADAALESAVGRARAGLRRTGAP